MATIKINYFNNAENKRTSTTFTEVTARFFLSKWKNDEDWTVTDSDNLLYRNTDEVKTEFQKAVNELIQWWDEFYKKRNIETKYWDKEVIEYDIMSVISHGRGCY